MFEAGVFVAGVYVKVCGITRRDDAIAAVDAGVDAIGLNFVPSSPRLVDLDTAVALRSVVPDHVMTVGVFRDQTVDEVLAVVDALDLRAVQLHGDEPPEVTAAVARHVDTVVKAVAPASAAVAAAEHRAAHVLMVDAPEPGGGVTFDWGVVGDLVDRHRVLLAGGLRPGNVREAIRRVRPWGVDVASGVERAPGVKDAAAMHRFVQAARA